MISKKRYIFICLKSRAFFDTRTKQLTVNAAGGAFCAPHFLFRFHPESLSHSFARKTGPRRLFRPFTFDPPFPLRISWTEPRSPLGRDFSLPSALCCVFCLPLPFLRATRVSCPSLSSVSVFAGDFFRPHRLARSSVPHRFFSFLTPGLGP